MAVVAKHRSEVPSIFPKAGLDDAPRVQAHEEHEPAYRPHEAEAPDRGVAPEGPEGRMGEAPDAGEGRAGYVEGEFTHGRSQS